jgi:hypothetical protein
MKMKPHSLLQESFNHSPKPITFNQNQEAVQMKPSRVFKAPLTLNLKSLTLFNGRSKAMKTKIFFATLLFAVFFLYSFSYSQVPQMINYQGTLTDASGNPVNGNKNMTFRIYDVANGGTALWTETQNNVPVENGVFNVLLGSATPIPFSVFNGPTKYLGVTVAPDPEMTPRREIVSVPYAYTDGDWDIMNNVLFTHNSWGIAGYGNTLYGNLRSSHVNFGRACTTGTDGQNYGYCTVGGGHVNVATGEDATVGGGEFNSARSQWATVGGGFYNAASGQGTAVGGGVYDTASGLTATIGGGYLNIASNNGATIGGGAVNRAGGQSATVAGGYSNTATGICATVPGGSADTVAGDYSFAAGTKVRIRDAADYTFAFGNNFITSASHAVIFHDTETPIKVGIGTTSPTERLDVAGTAKMTGFEMPTGASNGFVLTSNGSGVGTWAAPAAGPDQDWNYWTSSPNMFTIPTGNVGIGTTTPLSRLHVQNSTLADLGKAVQVDFGTAGSAITTQGIEAKSDVLVEGIRKGVTGISKINYSDNEGSAKGILGWVTGWDTWGSIYGVRGESEPSKLDNNASSYTSQAFGGCFLSQPPAPLNLNAVGTYYVGGVYARVLGEVNAGTNAVVAGVIGVDGTTGSATSYGGYFTSNKPTGSPHVVHAEYTASGNYDATAVYGRCIPASGYGVGGDFSGGNVGVKGDVTGGPAGATVYGGNFQAQGSSATTIVYGVYAGANSGAGGTAYGVYGHAGGSGPNIWAGYFNGRVYAEGNVGIGTTTPNTKVDINGDIALRAGSYTATNGVTNHNIAIGARSFVRITGPTAAFTITGIAGGQDGKMVILYNATGQNMTIANLNANSTAANQILTMSVDVGTIGTGNVTLIYDATAQKWIVTALMQ